MNDLVTLENRVLSLTIKKTPAPYIFRLVHKATGTTLVSALSESPLFTIVLEKPDGQDYVESSFAKTTGLDITRTFTGAELTITFSNFPNLVGLTVGIRGMFSSRDALTLWSIEVHNRTGRKIDIVRFPVLRAVPGIGDSDDDFIVLPDLPGTLIEKPWANWGVNEGVWTLRYPGELSAQFITYQDTSAGIYLAGRDATGYEKQLVIWKRADGFELFHDYCLSADIGDDWQSPYPIAIGVTQGTWHNSADIYKEWAVTQAWCAKTLSTRDDVPEWLKEGPLVYTCCVRTYDENGNETGSYYPRLLESLRYLKNLTGGNIVAMLAGWENHRRWTAGDYFPVFDEQNARTTIQQIEEEGFRPFFFLSGLFYTFENEGVNPSKIWVPEKYFPQFVVDGRTGKPQVFVVDESTSSYTWKRNSYAFCVGCPPVKSFFRKVIDGTSDLSVYILQMDQTVPGAGFPCYSSAHGHTPGIGLYQTKEFYALLKDMREYGKSKNPDFALFHEEPHEQLIPYLDGFHIREYMEMQWYRSYPGAVGIPLFSYLYHEYAIGYGGDGTHIGVRGVNTAWYVRAHAVNLVAGRTPAAATWFYPDELFNYDPQPVRMLRNHCQLLEAGAYRHLIEGRMLHPLEVNSPTLTYRFTQMENGIPKQIEFTGPSVLTSSWQAPDGSVGHLFVNVSEESQRLEVNLDTRNAPAMNPCDVFLFRSEAGDQFSPMWQAIDLPRSYSTELAPYEVLFLEIRRAG